jgi:hypothetical protein
MRRIDTVLSMLLVSIFLLYDFKHEASEIRILPSSGATNTPTNNNNNKFRKNVIFIVFNKKFEFFIT